MLWVVLGALALLVLGFPELLGLVVRWRLHGYRREHVEVDASRPARLERARTAAVVGAGVAGLTAALTLARRGFTVTVLEKQNYLGGKLGSWPVRVGDETQFVSHGFHAFFRHYANLNRVLDSLALRRGFRSIGDYAIVGRDGQATSFAQVHKTPVLNLLSMWLLGVFRLGDVMKKPTRDLMSLFLEYDEAKTFGALDHLTYADFDRAAKLPPSLKRAFNTFARAFFADEDKLSLAELVKSFHFYYLGTDGGLVYDHPTRDYALGLWAPLEAELTSLGATFQLGRAVTTLEKTSTGFLVDGAPFDAVVLAGDVVGTSAIATHARGFDTDALQQLRALGPGQRYAVLRLWADTDVREGLPAFVITERAEVLDAYAAYHRLEVESAEWATRHHGAVHEVHCYAVPEGMPDDEVKAKLVAELRATFPELKGMAIRHEHFQLRRDFTSFHAGLHANRPTVETPVDGLVCAGDWVRLPFPAMLLEAAASSGLLAANALLAREGLRLEPVASVPLNGLLHGVPAPPGRDEAMRALQPRRD